MVGTGKKKKASKKDGAGSSNWQADDLPPPPPPPAHGVYIPVWNPANDIRFDSQSEYETWYLYWRTRGYWPERQLLINSCSGRMLRLAVEVQNRRHLQEMLGPQGSINLTWVREWYAKLASSTEEGWPSSVTIRRVKIYLYSDTFNHSLRLPSSDHDTYTSYLGNLKKRDYIEGCRYLFKDGFLEGWPSKLQLGSLKPEYDFLLQFVNLFLFPTKSKGELHSKRYTMLHRLISQEELNIGDIIRCRMYEIAMGKKNVLMAYPCLITAICRDAQVPEDPADEFGVVPDAWDFGARQQRQATFRRQAGEGPSGQTEDSEESDEDDDDQTEEQPFIPTHQHMLDYGFASHTVSFAQVLNGIADRLNAIPTPTPVAPAPHVQLHYHGPPFTGFHQQYPDLWAADSTDYIPQHHVPYVQSDQPYPTYHGASSQFSSGTRHPMSYHSQFYPTEDPMDAAGYSSGQIQTGGSRVRGRRTGGGRRRRSQREESADDSQDSDFQP